MKYKKAIMIVQFRHLEIKITRSTHIRELQIT